MKVATVLEMETCCGSAPWSDGVSGSLTFESSSLFSPIED